MENICKIHTYDPVFTWCNKEAADALRNLLSYQYDIWQKGRFGKKKVVCKRYMIEGHDKGDYFFLSG